MSLDLFAVQRRLGEELLAAGWHASSIAVSGQPGSAWRLLDPFRRVRVRMSADLDAALAEATATHLPGSPHIAPLWRLTIHHAPLLAAATALRAAPTAEGGGTARDRQRIVAALRS